MRLLDQKRARAGGEKGMTAKTDGMKRLCFSGFSQPFFSSFFYFLNQYRHQCFKNDFKILMKEKIGLT